MSNNVTWRYLNNTFEINTRRSTVKMLSLSTDTHAKLKAEESNADIADILLIYEPVFFAYRDLDQQYGVKSGEYSGSTLGFEEYLDQIPLKLRQWESLIRAVYIEDSPEEKAIFPNKRTPFESGTYESRLDALGALKIKVAADAALTTAATQITSFYNASLGARLVQQTKEGALGQISDLRENQRVLLAGELMGVFGKLVFIHRHNPVEVERYFDLSLLTEQGGTHTVVRQVTLAPGGIGNFPLAGINLEKIISIEYEAIDQNAQFYAAASPTDGPGGTVHNLSANNTVVKTFEQVVTELGFGELLPYMNVRNNGIGPGTFKITLTVED